MRGADLPASVVDTVIRGATRSRMVFGPTIQSVVPSASRPARFEHAGAECRDEDGRRGRFYLDAASYAYFFASHVGWFAGEERPQRAQVFGGARVGVGVGIAVEVLDGDLV